MLCFEVFQQVIEPLGNGLAYLKIGAYLAEIWQKQRPQMLRPQIILATIIGFHS